jgi:hypothetical protein
MVLIEEIHNLLSCSARDQRAAPTTKKYLADSKRGSIVAAGPRHSRPQVTASSPFELPIGTTESAGFSGLHRFLNSHCLRKVINNKPHQFARIRKLPRDWSLGSSQLRTYISSLAIVRIEKYRLSSYKACDYPPNHETAGRHCLALNCRTSAYPCRCGRRCLGLAGRVLYCGGCLHLYRSDESRTKCKRMARLE